MKGTITIPKDEYLSLKVNVERLLRLEASGVDDWTWYGDALNPDGEPSIEDFEKSLSKEIEAK